MDFSPKVYAGRAEIVPPSNGRVVKYPITVDIYEDDRPLAAADLATMLELDADAADIGNGRVVDTAARQEKQSQADRDAPDGAAPARVRHAPLNAPSATIAWKARS